MIVDQPLVSQKVFHPRRSAVEPTLVVDVPGARLACFLYRPYPEAGVLLHFHGNGELASDYARVHANLFLAMGANVCFAEYRGYGASTGAPALAAMLPDGERILQALGVPPDRVVAFGRSLGSVYAVELARRFPGLAGLILESGIADLAEVLQALVGGTERLRCTEAELTAEITKHFDLKAALQGYRGRVLVLHAARDRLIDPAHAERLHAWAGGSDKRQVLFTDGDHNTILFANHATYVREVETFLRQAGVADRRRSQGESARPIG